MKLKFTIPYKAHWGEALHAYVSFVSKDGYIRQEDVTLQTVDGYWWSCETNSLQSPQHPFHGIIYHYAVVDGAGRIVREESLTSPRAYIYDASRSYTFADLWLEETDEEPTTKAKKKVPTIPDFPLYQQTVVFKVSAPLLRKGEALAVLGNHPTLGNWNPHHYLRMIKMGVNDWLLSVNVMAIDKPIEYKYVIIDEKGQRLKRWEDGMNRSIQENRIYDNEVLVLHGDKYRIKKMPPHAQFNFETYIFDLDGTLLSTLEDLKRSTNYALKVNGFPKRTLEEVRVFVGNGVKKLIERAVPDGQDNPLYEKVLADFREHYMEHRLDNTLPYPGIMEMLDELKARGKNIAVVSNKFYNATQALCQHFFGDMVDVAIGEREDIKKKPAPDTVNEALRLLNADRQKAVYIGDSDVDVLTARNCGIPCISVLWGFRDRDFLIRHGATIFVEKPQQIC